MLALVRAKRMPWAGGGGQTCKAGVAGAAMLALIFGLLGPLIQGVFAFVRADRVAGTGGGGQAGDAGVFSSTIFAVVVHS